MARTQLTVLVADLPSIIEDPERGVISLVGDHGGLSLITGGIEGSGLVMGALSIETEHGVVYLDPEQETEISEDDGQKLPVEKLDAINDSLSILLDQHFGGAGQSEADQKRLDDLTHAVAEQIQNMGAGE